jgi:hypothetical protein
MKRFLTLSFREHAEKAFSHAIGGLRMVKIPIIACISDSACTRLRGDQCIKNYLNLERRSVRAAIGGATRKIGLARSRPQIADEAAWIQWPCWGIIVVHKLL